MKKFLLIFFGLFVAVQNAGAAVAIKKAAPVATKQNSVKDMGASLLPTVINLVSGVQQLNQKQKALTEECVPTSQELNWVNTMVKEWAKTGAADAEEAERSMSGMKPCDNTESYESSVQMAADTDETDFICYDVFNSSSDQGTVWEGFPMASKASYCTDGSVSGCKDKYRVDVSNIYDVFNLIDFSESDYTAAELKMASKLMAKIENCSNAKLSAKKRAMWGEFLTGSISSMGQKTNSGTIMQAVTSVAPNIGTSGIGGAMQSLGGIATQFLAQ